MKDILEGSGGGVSAGGKGGNPTDDNLFSEDLVELQMAISEGPIVGLVDGLKSLYAEDTPLISPGNSVNFENFDVKLYHGADDATEVFNKLGGTSDPTAVGVTLEPDVPIVRSTPANLRGQFDRIEVRLLISQLYDTSKGGKDEHLTFRIKYREAGSGTWINLSNTTAEAYYGTDPIFQIKGFTRNGVVREFGFSVPRVDNDYEIQVTHVQDHDHDEDEEVRVMAWESFQVVDSTPRAYDNLAVLTAYSKISAQLSSVPNLWGVYAGRIIKVPDNYDPIRRTYTGTWVGGFKLAHTDNPAWILYDLLTDERYGAKRFIPDLNVNRFTAYDAAIWCDELINRPNGGMQPRYTYNEVVKTTRSLGEMARYIAAIFGGTLAEDADGTILFKVDRPQVPAQLFTPESVSKAGFSYQYTDVDSRVNSTQVSFINPLLGYETDVRLVEIDEFIQKFGIKSQKVVAVGCNDDFEARRRVLFRMIGMNTETQLVSFQVPRTGLTVEPFDVIGVGDPDMNFGLSGRIKSVDGNTIHLRDDLYIPTLASLTLTIQSGTDLQEVEVTRIGPEYTKELAIVSGALSNLPDRAVFSLESSNNDVFKLFRVMSIDEVDNEPDFYQLTALEINNNKYGDADNGSFTAAEYGIQEDAILGIPSKIENLFAESGDDFVLQNPDGSVQTRIHVTWDYTGETPAIGYKVFFRRTDRDFFTEVSTQTRSAYLGNVLPAEEYQIYVVPIGANGKPGIPSGIINHIVQGKTSGPPKPENWVIKLNPQSIVFVEPTDAEFDSSSVTFGRYELWVAEEGATFGTATKVANFKDSSYIYRVASDYGYKDYFIVAYDNLGNPSEESDAITAGPSDARLVSLSAGSQIFNYDEQSLNPSPATTDITANASGSPLGTLLYYEFLLDGVQVQHTTSNVYPYTPPAALTDMPDLIEVRVRETDSASEVISSDVFTLYGLQAGSSGLSMILTNENHSVPAANDGTVTSFNGAETDVLIFSGVTDVTNDWTLSKVDSAGVTSNLVGNTVTITAMSGDVEYVDITASKTGLPDITKRMTLSKAKGGTPGVNGIDGNSVAQLVIYRRATSTPTTPTGGSFNFDTKVLSAPTNWFVYPPPGSDPVYVALASASISGASGTDNSLTWSDPEILVRDGTDAKSTYQAAIYRRASSAPATPTGGSFNFGTNTLTVPTNWNEDVPNGNDPLYVTRALFSITGDTGTDNSVTWSTPTLFAEHGEDGTDGLSTFLVTIFRRSSSQPSTPSGGSYNFGTQVINEPTNWYDSIPSGTTSVWQSTALASIQGVTGTDSSLSWSTPREITRNGSDGTNGDTVVTGTVWRNSLLSSAPSKPSASSFNVSTGTFIGLTSGWGYVQPTVTITDTSLKEWSSQYKVTINGETGAQSITFTTPAGAIQVASTIESDNYDGTQGWRLTRSGGLYASFANFFDEIDAPKIKLNGQYIVDTGGGALGLADNAANRDKIKDGDVTNIAFASGANCWVSNWPGEPDIVFYNMKFRNTSIESTARMRIYLRHSTSVSASTIVKTLYFDVPPDTDDLWFHYTLQQAHHNHGSGSSVKQGNFFRVESSQVGGSGGTMTEYNITAFGSSGV